MTRAPACRSGTAPACARHGAAHEFFHCWNVERIRPAGLEPFDFTRENMSDGLWLAEGFTQVLRRPAHGAPGLTDLDRAVCGFGRAVNAVVTGSGRQFRSAAEMSRLAPFVDAGATVDRTDLGHDLHLLLHVGRRRSRSGSTCRCAR